MPTTEHTINDSLAGQLRVTRNVWRDPPVVRSENTGMLKGSAERPDILILEPDTSPVVVETEVVPATTVDADAKGRLGKEVSGTGREVMSAVAVRLPTRLRGKQGQALADDLASAADLEFALHIGSSAAEAQRWPESGWLTGNLRDLSLVIQSAAVPPDVVEQAADTLVTGVTEAAALLQEIAESNPTAVEKIGRELRQQDGEQTRRMAMTILVNALLFQETLAGGPGDLADVLSLEELRGESGGLSKGKILAEWRKILKVNYWPIFDIARRILQVIPTAKCVPLLERLSVTADTLLRNRVMRSHDLTGAVFQRLIIDRKFLAAFYTTPASATLLVNLAVTPNRPLKGEEWGDQEAVTSLRVADFACGTGTLLSSLYQRISQLHELAGGNAANLHPAMMSGALVGCDVLPAASHLTASMLAGAHPTVKYDRSSILTVGYGKQDDGTVALGSLDLLDAQGNLAITAVTAKAFEAMGESEKDTWLELPHAAFDVVVMNPPFTRATGHEASKIGIPNPMFAAFSSSEEEQRLMSVATKRLTEGTSAHGNAGEASIFLVLADRKLKQEGILALVMPLSLMAGSAWSSSRELLRKNYNSITLITLAGAEDAELSFSADTNMGECLLVAAKKEGGSKRAHFVVLAERPGSPLLGARAAHDIYELITRDRIHRLEDGPIGGTPLCFGTDTIGEAISAPLPEEGEWKLGRIADFSLAQVAYQLEEERIWLPTQLEADALPLPMATVEQLGRIGPYHMDINAMGSGGRIRGPFDIVKPTGVPSYPVLWAHDAETQDTLEFPSDSEGRPRQGNEKTSQKEVDEKVAAIWETRSHCHFNRDFRFNSQATGMQFTPEKAIGGRAWLSIQCDTVEQEKALVLWGNTTLGLLLYWFHSNKQQAGRGSIGKASLAALRVLDVRALPQSKIDAAVAIFDDLRNQKLLPLHVIDRDNVRNELDARFMNEVLDVPLPVTDAGGPLDLVRRKLAAEPSVRGQKSVSAP